MRTSFRFGICLDRVVSRMQRRPKRSAVLCTMLLAPMGTAIEIPSDTLRTDDSLTTISPLPLGPERITRLTFAGGQGTYGRTIHASRTISLGYYGGDGCSGGGERTRQIDSDFRFEHEYNDYGGEFDTQVNNKSHIGVRGGWINETAHYRGSSLDADTVSAYFGNVDFDSTITTSYFNPYYAFEGENVGWGIGVVFADNQLWRDEVRKYGEHDNPSTFPTGHLRVGELDKLYLKASLWEGVPIYSGGGMFNLGAGLHPGPVELYAGWETGGPYTDSGLLLRGSLDLGRHVTAGANVRLSSDSDTDFMPTISESGGSVFLTYKFIRH